MSLDRVVVVDALGRLVVAGAFGWAAVGKLADLPSLRATLYLSRVTRPWVPQLAAGLPAVELLLGAALLGARVGWFAAAASAALLLAFIAYLALDRTSGQGCACFGSRTSTSRRAGVVRDLLLLAALVPALAGGPSAARPGVPEPAEPWALGVAALVVAGAVGWALRRDGRRRSGHGRAGRRRAGAPPVTSAPAIRQAVPFDVVALDGSRLRLRELAARPGGVVVLFVEVGCALCEALLPRLAGRADTVVLAAVLDPADVDAWARARGLPPSRVAADVDGAVADSYRVPANPAACRVDPSGLLVDAAGTPVSRLAVGPDAITQLLAPG